MMKLRLAIIFFLITSSSFLAIAQTNITGKIIDECSQPMSFVNVVLISSEDSTFIVGTITKDDGTFHISSNVKEGVLKISCVGYKTKYVNPNIDNLNAIQLQPETKKLGEIIIKSHRPLYKMSDDGMIIDVQNSLLKQSGTANEVLSQLPRVSGSNGNFTVFGKGRPIIYINNRRIINTSELSQLRSSDIKDIEVITNPGAQYGGDVQSVIRIRTIKQRGNGLSFSSYSFGNFSRKFSPMESLNVKYHHNKWELFGNFRIHSLHNKQFFEYEQSMRGINYIQETGRDTIFNNGDKQIKGQMGVCYDIDKNNSFGLSYIVTKSLHDVINSASALDFYVDNTAKENTMTNTQSTLYHTPEHEINAYYVGKLGKLGIDINATYYSDKQTRTQNQGIYSDMSGIEKVDIDNVTRNKMIAGKINFMYPLKNGGLNIGSEYTGTKSVGSNINSQKIFDDSDTKIEERNIAAFAEYVAFFGRFRTHAGLRYEHVVSDYYSKGIWQAEPSRKYSDLFPNISLSWSKDKWQIQIGYNSKTSRPSYRNLSSWMQYDNRYEYQGGNPMLKPAYINSLELNVNRDWLTFNIGYKHTKRQVAYVMRPYDGNIFIKTYANINRIQNLYTSLTASPRWGFYKPVYEINVSKQLFDDETYSHEGALERPLLTLRLNNRFAIHNDFTISVNMSYHTSYANTVSLYKEGDSLDLNIYKSFFKGALSVYLWGRDLLKTQNRRYTMFGINGKYTTNQDMDTRCFSIGIQYNFNATKSMYKGTGAGNGEKYRL